MKTLITREIIDNALKFYSISDNEYKIKCYKCVDEIQQNSNYQDRVNNIYNILFIDKNNTIKKLWHIKNSSVLFGNISNPFITNVLLLSGYKIHKDNIKKYRLDEKQVKIHKQRVREALVNDIKIRGYDGIRISQMLWGAYFINYCSSWLLSLAINKILDKNSNISKFYNMFDIIEEKDGLDDILNFVFNVRECNDYTKLIVTTSLQIKLKEMLLKNERLTIGVGVLNLYK